MPPVPAGKGCLMDSASEEADARHAKQTPTGLPNHVYDLVLLLQQAAEDVVRYTGFSADARAAGDDEFADWCDELAESDRAIVARARAMLAARL
jgi:predicted NBD/HSP70 family sugar kinase